jgi:hypothetical protein
MMKKKEYIFQILEKNKYKKFMNFHKNLEI